MYDVRAIGNWFLNRADQEGKILTAMKLQKLAYVAHGWHLAFTDKPLVHDAVEAWKWGPVFRPLYHEFREFGSEPIGRRATVFDGATLEERIIQVDDYAHLDEEPMSQTELNEFLESVWNVYGTYSAVELSDITHQPGTPWYDMLEKMGHRIRPYTVIPNDLILQHYKTLLNERSREASTSC